jgi:hypothetical protein
LLLSLTLPRINAHMTTAIVGLVHAGVGAALPIGGKLMDLTIDLSAAAPHDCPPISHYRLTLRDKVWLRRLDVAAGDEPEVGASLALFSTEPDEPLDAAPARAVRLAIAGVIAQSAWDEDLS